MRGHPVVVALVTVAQLAAGAARVSAGPPSAAPPDGHRVSLLRDIAPLVRASDTEAPPDISPVAMQVIPDAPDDAYWAPGDIVSAGLNAGASGITAVGVSVASYDSPYSLSWQYAQTGVFWDLDVNGDGATDFWTGLVNDGGALVAAVLDAADQFVCAATPAADSASKSYGVQFASGCLGNPPTLGWAAAMFYEDYDSGNPSTDLAPDYGWAGPVANDASQTPSPSSSTSPSASGFNAVSPRRVFDTRPTEEQGLRPVAKAPVGGDYVLQVQMTDLGGVVPASGVGAVSLNVTVTQPQGPGFVTVYPCGERNTVSNLNFDTGQTVPNAVLVPVSPTGTVCFYSLTPAHLIADINGWFAAERSDAVVLGSAAGPAEDTTSATAVNDDGSAHEVSDRYIVRLAPGADLAGAARQLAANGLSIVHSLPSLNSVVVTGSPADVAPLSGDSHFSSVERDQPVRVDDPASEKALAATAVQDGPVWGLDRIDQHALPLSNTYEYPAAGTGVSVYVVDSGIRADHTEFAGRVLPGYAAVLDGNGTSDCNGHGTHVAGTVGGATYGVAKRVTLIPVRVLNCSGVGSSSQVLAGLNWIVSDHQAGVPAVVNMSLGGPPSGAVDTAVQALISDGITVVVAAGNKGVDACLGSPARVPEALTVAATDSTDHSPSWSNYGSCVDLFAPGVGITSAGIASTTATATYDGTSMATPHVAGAAAVLLSLKPSWDPAGLSSKLLSQATVGAVTNPSLQSVNRLLYMPPAAPNLFHAIAPERVFDTRPGEGGWREVPKTPVGGGYVLAVQMTDLAGLVPPSGVSAVSLNVTVTQPQGPGFVTVFPCGGMPVVSSLNYLPGQTVPNAVIAPVSGSGMVCFYSLAPTDIVVDINGWFAAVPGFTAVGPGRVFDTRPGEEGLVPVAKAKVGGGYVLQVQMTGVGGLVPASGVSAFSLNVTVTQPEGPGFVTVFPCDTMPVVSSLNYSVGQTVPNAVLAPVSPSGTVCFYALAPTDLIADINGWFATPS